MKFPLRAYLAQAKRNGASELYLDEVRKRAAPLAAANIPVLLSLGHIAFVTGCPFPALLGIVQRKNDLYRIFAINKRTGGLRYICVPNPSLMTAQRWIHDNILISKTVLSTLNSSVKAYVPGSSHVENASEHLHAEWIVKIDLS